MKTDCNRMAGQADQADLYYRHNYDIGVYFESYVQMAFGSELESVEVSKKNQGGSSNLDYICLKMDR